MISVVSSNELASNEVAEIRRLLDEAFDGDFTDDDWAHSVGGVHVLVRDGDEMVAHASVVPRALRFGESGRDPIEVGYVEAVATLAARQGRGHGTRAMAAIAEVIAGTWRLGVLSTGEHEFYERLGWQRWRGPTWVRGDDGRARRTPDEDDGIMVLVTAGAPPIDLDGSIECDARPGDDW